MKNPKKKSLIIIDDGNLPSGSQWQKILLEIYNHAPHQYGYSALSPHNDDNHPLAKKLNIRGYELMLGISFLYDQGLIKERVLEGRIPTIFWILEKKGFDVVLDLKKFNSSQRTQNMITYFTIIVALTGIFQFIAELDLFATWIVFAVYAVVLFTIALIIVMASSDHGKNEKNSNVKKTNWWQKIIKFQGEYFFGAGLGLVIAGATLIWDNPQGILYAGVIIFIIGVIIRSFEK